jgi:hypothetical protein
VSCAVLYRPLGSGPIGKLLRRGRRPWSAMANRVSIWGNLMLYRPVSMSHGGKTSGGRVAVVTAEAMDGVEEKMRAKWG